MSIYHTYHAIFVRLAIKIFPITVKQHWPLSVSYWGNLNFLNAAVNERFDGEKKGSQCWGAISCKCHFLKTKIPEQNIASWCAIEFFFQLPAHSIPYDIDAHSYLAMIYSIFVWRRSSEPFTFKLNIGFLSHSLTRKFETSWRDHAHLS